MLAHGQAQHVLRGLRGRGVASNDARAIVATVRTGSAKRKRRVSCDSSVRLTSGSSTCALEQLSARAAKRWRLQPCLDARRQCDRPARARGRPAAAHKQVQR